MKRVSITGMIVLMAAISFAQDPVQWNYSVKKIADKAFEFHITATIDYGWHLYSQKQPEDAIAVPTSIKFDNNPLLTFSGKIKEIGKMEKHTDATLGITQNQYSNKVEFVQQIKLKSTIKTNVTGNMEFQVCTDEMCLPPKTINFNVAIK